MGRLSFSESGYVQDGAWWKPSRMRRPGTCFGCEAPIPVGHLAAYAHRAGREIKRGTTLCYDCARSEGLMR